MADIGNRSGKIGPGHYRCGKYEIKKLSLGAGWCVTLNGVLVKVPLPSLFDARQWCKRSGCDQGEAR